MSTKRTMLVAFAMAAVGCGSSDESASSSDDCGHSASNQSLSVIARSYDDVGGGTACTGAKVAVYARKTSDAQGPSGLVTAPTEAPIANGTSTASQSARFMLPDGEYVVCLDEVQRSCGVAVIAGNRVYGTFTGGPQVQWTASEDITTSLR